MLMKIYEITITEVDIFKTYFAKLEAELFKLLIFIDIFYLFNITHIKVKTSSLPHSHLIIHYNLTGVYSNID